MNTPARNTRRGGGATRGGAWRVLVSLTCGLALLTAVPPHSALHAQDEDIPDGEPIKPLSPRAPDGERITPLDPVEDGPFATEPTTAPASQPAGEPTTRPLPRSQRPEVIDRTVQFFLQMYEGHLKGRDWIARSMAVISLSRIDDPRMTERLLKVLVEDETPIVRVYAYEALHGRLDRMTDEQRALWVAQALELGRKGYLWGDLRVGLIGAMAMKGCDAETRALFKGLFNHTNSLNPGDIRTLWALGDLLKQWRSPDLVQTLIGGMGDLNYAYRAELVLHRIDPNVPPIHLEWKDGSAPMCEAARARWARWYAQRTWEEAPRGTAGTYGGRSLLMPHGERILDTADPQWSKDYELPRFGLNQLDVGFAVDSTGSMGATVRWIQRDVIRMMKAFELISREPRISIVLYRDRGDEYVVQPIALSDNAQLLAKQLRGASAAGGGDIPEAVYEGLHTLIKGQQWSGAEGARKVVVLLGDAPPQERTLSPLYALVTDAAKNGFLVYTIKIRSHYRNVRKLDNYDKPLTTFDRIAELGNGKSFWVDFLEARSDHRRLGTAGPIAFDSPEQVILREVLKAVLRDDYQDRVDPFINVLIHYVDQPIPEQRRPWDKPSPGGGGPGKPPKDPQER